MLMDTPISADLSGFDCHGKQSMNAAGKLSPAKEWAVPLKSEATVKPFSANGNLAHPI